MKKDSMVVKRKINVKAERLVSGNELMRVMSFLPNAKLISRGNYYSFDLDLGTKPAKLQIDLYRDSISLEFKSRSAEDLSLCDISILTLSILAYLKDSYSAKLESLYPILMDSLRGVKKDNPDESKNESAIELYKEIRRSNIVLSEIAIKKIRENAIKSTDLSKFSNLFQSISKAYWNDDNAISRFCTSSGVEIETVKWAIGYKRVLIDESI